MIKRTIAALVGIALIALALPATAQSARGSFTLPAASVAASASSNLLSATGITLLPGQQLAVMPITVGTNTAGTAGTVIFKFNVSIDGTNYTSTNPLTVTNTCSTTNVIKGFAVLSTAITSGAYKIRLDGIQNTDTNGTQTITAVLYRQFPQ